MKKTLGQALAESIKEAGYLLPPGDESDLIDLSRDPKFGDWSSSVAFSIGKSVKKNPREVARDLSDRLKEKTGAEECEVAGGGFVNLWMPAKRWQEELWRAYEAGPSFGRGRALDGHKILLEFVSANPTGPLHVGHGRNAAIGDALGRLLDAAGAAVRREYYVNDIGGQIETLCASVVRSLDLPIPDSRSAPGRRGRDDDRTNPSGPVPGAPGMAAKGVPIPEFYSGPHIDALGLRLKSDPSTAPAIERYIRNEIGWAEFVSSVSGFLVEAMLADIRKDLADFRVPFDSWAHESRLQAAGAVRNAIEKLRDADIAYDKDGAVWFKSSEFGDEKDRVLVRETGVPTYFASDIAYHLEKANGEWTEWVNIWGADHHGYIKRVAGAVKAMGKDPERLKVILVQMVSLIRGGQRAEMSKRKGTFVTLREVMDEVGADAARFFYLMREADSQLDFDMDLAKTQSEKNPVYYVQYAHARVASLLAHASERGLDLPAPPAGEGAVPGGLPVPGAPRMAAEGEGGGATSHDSRFTIHGLAHLNSDGERDLIKWSTYFPWIVLGAAKAREPHRVVFYLIDLVRKFHHYYNEQRIVTEDQEASAARLVLCKVFGAVVKNGLEWIGVSAPEKM